MRSRGPRVSSFFSAFLHPSAEPGDSTGEKKKKVILDVLYVAGAGPGERRLGSEIQTQAGCKANLASAHPQTRRKPQHFITSASVRAQGRELRGCGASRERGVNGAVLHRNARGPALPALSPGSPGRNLQEFAWRPYPLCPHQRVCPQNCRPFPFPR